MRGQSPLSAVDRRKADWVNDYDDLSNSKPSAVPPNISYPAYEERGQYAVLLKPRTDNRDGEDEIKSRIGLSAPAEYVDDFLQEISKCWNVETSEYIYHEKRVAAVLVDEAQFLSPEEVDRLSDIVDFYDISVLCYGLRTDFLNHHPVLSSWERS